MKKIFLALIILISINLYSQDTTKLKLITKFHPSSVINIFRPTIQGSLEFMCFDKYSFEIGFGKRFFSEDFETVKTDTSMVAAKGKSFLLEFKYYKPSKNINDLIHGLSYRNYYGLTYKSLYDIKNAMVHYSPPNYSTFIEDCYVIERINHVFEFQIGYVLSYNIYSIETCCGIGLRNRNINLLNNEFNSKTDSFAEGLWPWERAYTGLYPSLSLGVKFNVKII